MNLFWLLATASGNVSKHNSDMAKTVASRHACGLWLRLNSLASIMWCSSFSASNELGFAHASEQAHALTKKASTPIAIDASMVELIPSTPGVHLFFGENALPLHITSPKESDSQSHKQGHLICNPTTNLGTQSLRDFGDEVT